MSDTFGIKRKVEPFQGTICGNVLTQGIPASRETLGCGVERLRRNGCLARRSFKFPLVGLSSFDLPDILVPHSLVPRLCLANLFIGAAIGHATQSLECRAFPDRAWERGIMSQLSLRQAQPDLP